MSDLEVLKEIPGYKAILKSVLKSQIQLLMEQLSEHTGEESIILTASVHDGSLSHLGSNTGKGFLEGRDEIKSQFLGYCLKTYHKKKTHEPQKPYQRTHPSPRSPAQIAAPSAKRSRIQPVTLTRASPVEIPAPLSQITSETSDSNSGLGTGAFNDSFMSVKSEEVENEGTEFSQHDQTESGNTISYSSREKSVPDSVHLSHTQTSGAGGEPGSDNVDNAEESADMDRSNVSDISSIKVEQVEDELEITGVEMAAGGLENWGQGQQGYGQGDSSFDQPADQSGYKLNMSDNAAEKDVISHGRETIPAGVLGVKFENVTGSVFSTLSDNQSVSRTGSWTGSSTSHSKSSLQSYVFEGQRYFFDTNSVKKVVTEQDYPCNTCGKVYHHRQHLLRHLSVHTGERIFKCSLCPKDFRLKHHLKEHLILVHKKAPKCVEPFIVKKK